MGQKTCIEHSRRDFSTFKVDPTIEEIQMGATQRIADAAEGMAKNHTRLINDLEYYKSRVKSLLALYLEAERYEQPLRV